ncbi:MAG: S8 family serine peptidase [Candidatus Thermoplasmatota archaeon]
MSLVAAFLLILTCFAPTSIAIGPGLPEALAVPTDAPAHENVLLKAIMADADKDGIEDGVDAKAAATPGAVVTIHLLYDRRPTDADASWLGDHLPVQRSYLFHNVDRVKVETTAASVPLFLSAPGVVAIQEFVAPVLANDIGSKAIRAVAAGTSADGLDHAQAAHAAGYKGQGMVVAVLDTGVDERHPYVNDMDFHDGTDAPKQVLGVTLQDGFTIQCLNPVDDNGHGSHVAGTAVGTGGAVGETNGFPGLSGALTAATAGVNMGAAPGAKYVDVDIAMNAVATAVGTGEDLAFDWIMDYNNGVATCAEGIDTAANRIDVATMSFGAGGDAPSSARSVLITAAVRSGITTTIAAGNDGCDAQCTNPGAQTQTLGTGAEGAIVVAASDDRNTVGRGDDRIAGFSSRGKRASDADADTLDELRPDIAAPGSNIVSTNHLYTKEPLAPPSASMSGTSMATPFVAGVAALILQANPDLRPVDSGSWQTMGNVDAVPVRDILQQTATSKTATEGAAPQSAQVGKFGKTWNNAWGYGLIDAYAAIRLAEDLGNALDSDGDGVSDAQDRCPGFDDLLDADGDGAPDGCDGNSNDGPLGDLDGDGVTNAADQCPGLDDASPECVASPASSTFYLGRGALASSSGNLDVLSGGLSLVMDETAPEYTDPAVILAPGLDGVDPHNSFYEPAEWRADRELSVNGAEVEVVWWAMAPVSGAGYYPAWDVVLYFDGVETARTVLNSDILLASVPSEYRVTLPAVVGDGVASVLIDPTNFIASQDFLILYDGIDYPSRVLFGPNPVQDSDGDGVADDVDNCPTMANDQADLDGDGAGDACDGDRDGDGVDNASDAFPDDASESADSDGDGVGDNADACPGHDDAADWDLDGIPDGCDDRPGVEITSPAAGATTPSTLTITGTTPGTADFASSSIRIPALTTFATSGLVPVEPWMHDLDARMRTVPGYRGLIPVGSQAGGVLHLVVDGGLTAGATPVVPAGWTVEVHAGLAAKPLSLRIDGAEARSAAVAELPRGGAVSQGLGPGTPLYTQLDGNTNSVGICTANFVWKDQDGRLWLGAAGHCFMPESVTNNNGAYDYARTKMFACLSECPLGGLAGAQAFFEWQAGAPLDFVELGEVGYARQNGVGQDFGIVAIPVALAGDIEPEMPVWGGPYGVDPNGFVGDLDFLYGNGVAVAETVATKARVGVGDGDGGDKTSWTMIGLSNGGDSGSGVNSLSTWAENGDLPLGPQVPDARGILTHGYADPVTGLLPSIPIVFGTTVAQAQAMAGEGGFCLDLVFADEDPITRPAAPLGPACQSSDLPGQVTGLTAAAGDGQVSLAWSPPSDGGAVTGYAVHYGAGDTRDQSLVMGATATSATVTGLDNGVLYTFAVSASNDAGEGLSSAPVAATPAEPVRFSVEVRVDGGAWSAVADYDAAAESWQVALASLSGGPHTVAARLMDFGVERDQAEVAFNVVTDADGDGVADDSDNCPTVANDQADLDGDGAGDACDGDRDGDGVDNATDAFPDDANESADSDGDGVGDNADAFPNDATETVDSDGDGVGDHADAFPNDPAETSDSDGDGVGDNADACAGHDDAADLDGDGTPDGCDADRDGDGYSNDQETEQGSDPDDANSTPDNPWTTSRCDDWQANHPGHPGGPPACRID